MFSNQAGWKCDECREAGLESRRRCRWAPSTPRLPERVVWGRKQVSLTTCPKSYVTAQSVAWLEEFLVRRKLARHCPPRTEEDIAARDAEAFLILESELEREMHHG